MAIPDVDSLLTSASRGDAGALDQLTSIVFAELHALARSYMRGERRDHTLQTTALVNEAYLRLVRQQTPWQNQAHFLGIAAQAMRRVLVDHARARHAVRRGRDCIRISGEITEQLGSDRCSDLVRLDDALTLLATVDPLKHRIVELRYFGGLTLEQAARVLNVSPVTVGRHWRLARAWLRREVARDAGR